MRSILKELTGRTGQTGHMESDLRKEHGFLLKWNREPLLKTERGQCKFSFDFGEQVTATHLGLYSYFKKGCHSQ